ncbi:hypothetical protein BDW62DRAFT_213483 [Aspergillus aurantiobrunneus]
MAHWIRKTLRLVRLSKRRDDERLLASPQEEPPLSFILGLPVDILLLIVPHLPLVFQACLALTCKPLYSLLRSVHEDERLAWPRYLASPLPCSSPRDHFTWGNTLVPPLERYCKNFVCVADLCACLALTYLNGVQLAEWIQTGLPSQYLHQNIRQKLEFRVLDNKRFLIHSCSVTSQPDAFVALTIMVAVNADNCLIVTTNYNVYWPSPHKYVGDTSSFRRTRYRAPHNTEAIFLCPHIHALGGLYGPYSSTVKRRGGCDLCDTKVHMLRCTDDGLYSVIQAERNSGIIRKDPCKGLRELGSSQRWWNSSRFAGAFMEHRWYY